MKLALALIALALLVLGYLAFTAPDIQEYACGCPDCWEGTDAPKVEMPKPTDLATR